MGIDGHLHSTEDGWRGYESREPVNCFGGFSIDELMEEIYSGMLNTIKAIRGALIIHGFITNEECRIVLEALCTVFYTDFNDLLSPVVEVDVDGLNPYPLSKTEALLFVTPDVVQNKKCHIEFEESSADFYIDFNGLFNPVVEVEVVSLNPYPVPKREATLFATSDVAENNDLWDYPY